MMRIIIVYCLLLVGISNVSNAQENFRNIEELVEYFDEYHSEFPRERVYLHVDRSYYSPGDDVWLKGYITLGNFNKLSNHSKLVYVDLIGPNDALIHSIILPISEGMAIGDFSLPTSLLNGSYRIRAYTNWMRNFDQKDFFERSIRVLNASSSTLSPKVGMPNNNVSEPSHAPGSSYVASDHKYGIAVNNLLDKSIIVELKIDSNEVKGQDMQLLLQQDGEVFVAFKLTADKTTQLFNIPREVLGDGINEIVLLSENMEPLVHRKVFSLHPSRQLDIQLETDKKRYLTREKVKVKVHLANQNKSLGVGFFSTSVTSQKRVPEGKESNSPRISMLLWKPSLTINRVNDSSFTRESSASKLDSLLLKSGKEEVWMAHKQEIKFAAEKDFNISGSVRKMNGKPESGAVVTLFEPNSAFILDTISDADGHFKFDQLLFNDSAQFIVQAITEKGNKNLEVLIDTVEVPSLMLNGSVSGSEYSSDRDEAYIENNRKRTDSLIQSTSVRENIMLNEVNVNRVLSRNKVTHSANLNGPGNADQVLLAKDLENCISLETCLQGLLVGITFRNGDAYSMRSPTIPMKVIVDGVYMGEEALSVLNPFDVETIEVLRNVSKLAVYGMSGGGGTLLISTKQGNTGTVQKGDAPGVVSINPRGLSAARDFVSPNYSSKEHEAEGKDIRPTIYWNPNVRTNEDGESFFEFYTSDDPGMYKIMIEGVDAEGRIGSASMEFEVK